MEDTGNVIEWESFLDNGRKRNDSAESSNDSVLVKERERWKNVDNLKAHSNTGFYKMKHRFIPVQNVNETIEEKKKKPKLGSKEERKVFVLESSPCNNMHSCGLSEVQDTSSLRKYIGASRKMADQKLSHNNSREHNSQAIHSRRNVWNSSFETTFTDYDRYFNEEKLSFKEVATMFLKKSSIYALNQIGNSKTSIRKLFWSFIMVAGLLGCGSQIFFYLNAFFEYPVVVNIDSVSEFSQVFPGVTLCNFNVMRKTFIPCLIRQLSYEECNETTFTNQSDAEFKFNFSQPSCFFGEVNKTFNSEDTESMEFYNLYSRLNEATRKHYGHQGARFIRSCSFKGESCSHKDFRIFIHPYFGNCFTFNAGNQSKPPLNTSSVGLNGALNLELDLETDEYLRITTTVGARIVIHDPYHDPNPQQDGINISPGFETAIGISLVSFRRLPYPYKDQCGYYQPGDNQQRCTLNCINNVVYTSCSCNLPFQSNIDGGRQCDLTNDTEICCLYQSFNASEIQCYCPLECENSIYETKISSAVWPSRAYSVAKFEKEMVELGNERWRSVESLRKTRLKLNVYYNTLQHLIYQQRPMFDDSEVLSQVGGQMGLWLGLSLVAIFECVENLFLIWRFHSKKNH